MKSSAKMLLFMTVLLGGIYPLSITILSNILFHNEANGSFLVKNKKKVGSELIAQEFKADKYFWPRPSAVNYNPQGSSGSNLAATDKKYKYLEMETNSASGLDPHISLESALKQVARVSKARNVKEADLLKLINDKIEDRQFKILGEKRINVLKLNLALGD